MSSSAIKTAPVGQKPDNTLSLVALDRHAGIKTAPSGANYETVAASQTDQVLGAAGAAGDVLERLVIRPAAANAGSVMIKDGASGPDITVYVAQSAAPLTPVVVELGVRSTSGGWRVTTGANVSVIAVGQFS